MHEYYERFPELLIIPILSTKVRRVSASYARVLCQ